MWIIPSRIISRSIIAVVLLVGLSVNAQSMRDNITTTFNDLLSDRLELSPGQHGEHFLPSNVASSDATINAFTNFVTSNISSFPLSSTSAGLTFDFSSGQPVSTTTSLGPIFAERAQTLGQGRFNFGLNFTNLGLNKIRGLDMEDLRFTFTHEDVGAAGLGDSDNEFDNVDLFMNMNLNASILAFVGTVGITDRIDIGVAVPFVNLSMEADPMAVMNSYTTVVQGFPNHFFAGENGDTLLSAPLDAISDDATGIGDMAVRLKVNFVNDRAINVAALAEYRAPTGDEENFLGAGAASYKGALILSGNVGDFSPHANIGYEVRSSDLDRNEFEVFLGFDQKVSETFTLAVDLLAELEVGSQIEELTFPENVTVSRTFGENIVYTQVVDVTNIPRFDNDHQLNASFGAKFNPKEGLVVVSNVFIPLNDGGVRSNFIPTVGFEFSF